MSVIRVYIFYLQLKLEAIQLAIIFCCCHSPDFCILHLISYVVNFTIKIIYPLPTPFGANGAGFWVIIINMVSTKHTLIEIIALKEPTKGQPQGIAPTPFTFYQNVKELSIE